MELRLPPIRDLNLSQADYPRDERLAKVLAHCQALCAFADHYAFAPSPDQSEVALMVDRAVEVITILEDYRRASYPPPPAPVPAPTPAPVARPPKRPWEDAADEQAGRRVAASPPADRPSSSSPPRVPAAQEAHMHVFDGVPERIVPLDDSAKAVAARDMDDIRARRAAGQAAAQGKVKYKKRSRASPPGQCHSCEILDTPEWRRGPDGQRTLCNACGLHYAKLVRKRDRIISTLPAGGPVPPPIDIAYLRRSARLAAENSALARSAGRRRAADESKKGSKPESSKRTGGAGRDAGRRGWGRRQQQAAEPAQSSFPRTQATSPYPPPPSLPQMSSSHASSPVQPMSLPPSLPPMNTLPSMRQSYPPLVSSYSTAPHPYPPSYAQPSYPMQPPPMQPYGPHGYAQQPHMPGSMPPPPPPGPWDHYAPGNNGREPRS